MERQSNSYKAVGSVAHPLASRMMRVLGLFAGVTSAFVLLDAHYTGFASITRCYQVELDVLLRRVEQMDIAVRLLQLLLALGVSVWVVRSLSPRKSEVGCFAAIAFVVGTFALLHVVALVLGVVLLAAVVYGACLGVVGARIRSWWLRAPLWCDVVALAITLSLPMAFPASRERIDWACARIQATPAGYLDFLRIWPQGTHTARAYEAIDAIYWKAATLIPSAESLFEYLRLQGADGAHSEEAALRIEKWLWPGLRSQRPDRTAGGRPP